MNITKLEQDLWSAADQLRANSKLTAAEYAMPVLGLIFLRYAYNRFQAVEAALLPSQPLEKRGVNAGKPKPLEKWQFQAQAAMFLPEAARYDHLVGGKGEELLSEKLETAMTLIETEYPELKGALPKVYKPFEQKLLRDLVRKFNSDWLKKADGDVIGKIYEYFLNKFAQTGAQEGGEFFTPPSLVKMIVNVIEPDHGTVFDPACGSMGMAVQTGHFVATHTGKRTVELSIFGQEKADLNTKLGRMNLAVHGLAGEIKQANTFYEDAHKLLGQCDYVMANPPFNVDGVEVAKIETEVGVGKRLPFGLPGTNAKTGAISNANSLWLQYFYSYLNDTGRAGFVMASSASDSGNKDKDIREKLVNTGHVDVMIGIGNKFFYTRSLPCTLWFYDKDKPDDLLDSVLMMDARHIYHVVSARSHVFTEAQLQNLTAIVWLYRGEQKKFLALLARYQADAKAQMQYAAQVLPLLSVVIGAVLQQLQAFVAGVVLDSLPAKVDVDATLLQVSEQNLQAAQSVWQAWQLKLPDVIALAECAVLKQPEADALKQAHKHLEHLLKTVLTLQGDVEKQLRARAFKHYDNKLASEHKAALLPAPDEADAEPSLRDQVSAALLAVVDNIRQEQWLRLRFPLGLYEDVAGLCKQVSRAEIAANDWSLTPGRYVGVAPLNAEDSDDFVERMRDIHSEIAELNAKSAGLAVQIAQNFEALMMESNG